MSGLATQFSKLVSAFATSGADLTPAKLLGIVHGLFFIFILSIVFAGIYLFFTRGDSESRKLFYATAGLLGVIVLAKYFIFHFYQGYVPDRLLFYALPSPKAANAAWFILPMVIFCGYLYLRKKIIALSTNGFLFSLWVSFISLAFSVAATREGFYSMYERFTRTYWEYTGNLHLVNGVIDFLHNYGALTADLVNHTITHPPGFTLLLYLAQQALSINYLGLSVFVILFGGLSIFPAYYLLRQWAEEPIARRAMEVFIFLPSFVLLGATSMDVTFLFATTLALSLLYIGWARNAWLAALGGLAAGVALLMNFLFLLLAPLFLYLIYLWWTTADPPTRRVWRVIISVIVFFGWWLSLYWLTGYSIIDNFFMAQAAQGRVVESNFTSVGTYLLYALMNVSSFGIYLGLANAILLGKQIKIILANKKILGIGFAVVVWFVLIGIFQGEVERIWLFVLPWFLLPIARATRDLTERQFAFVLALSWFQIILTQTLFYTYW